jgi:hypothetical protein
VAKIFLDENLSHEMTAPLGAIFKAHRFKACRGEGLVGYYDEPLFEELGARDFGAIITLDAKQLENAGEREGLRQAGLHWIGLTQPAGSGLAVLAGLAAMVIAGLPHVLDDWRTEPHIYRLSSGVVNYSRPTVERL